MWIHILYVLYMRWYCIILSLTCCTSGCCNTNKEALVQMGCGGSVRKLRAAFLFARVLGSFMKILKWWWGIKHSVKPLVFYVVWKNWLFFITNSVANVSSQILWKMLYFQIKCYTLMWTPSRGMREIPRSLYNTNSNKVEINIPPSAALLSFSFPPTHAGSFMCKVDRWSQLTC